MCAVLAVGVRMGISFSTALWVAYMRLLLGGITWRLFFIGFLLLHGLLTLIQLGVALLSSMPYFYRLVCGYPLHVFLVLLNFYKSISLCVTLILIVLDLNRQRPCGRPKVLSPKCLVVVASALWPCILLLHYALPWITAPCLNQYGVLHQMGWWACPSLLHFVSGLPLLFSVAPAPAEWYDL